MYFPTVCLTLRAAREDSEAEWFSDRPKVTDLPWRKLGCRSQDSGLSRLPAGYHVDMVGSARQPMRSSLVFSWTFLVCFPVVSLWLPVPLPPPHYYAHLTSDTCGLLPRSLTFAEWLVKGLLSPFVLPPFSPPEMQEQLIKTGVHTICRSGASALQGWWA